MTNYLKYAGVAIAGVVVGMLLSAGGVNLGGVYSEVTKDFSQGISVDGTTIIDGSGAITATTGSFSSTLAVTATSTLSDTVNFNNPGICINLYATSTATIGHMVASTTATIEGVDGVMLFAYGACAL